MALAPLAVSGRHFGAREPVLVTYLGSNGATRAVGVRASRKGTFRARFYALRVGRCDAFTVRATGTRGSRAVLQVDRRCGKPKGPPERAPRERPGKPGRG